MPPQPLALLHGLHVVLACAVLSFAQLLVLLTTSVQTNICD
jgi:hypothetical protein